MKKLFKDFKAFISRGNIMDLAVGVIIGGAFSAIVTSLVNDIIMPLITWAFGAESLADLSIPLQYAEDGTVSLAWNYGNFIQSVIDFLLIAIIIFIMIRVMMKSQTLFKEAREDFYNGRLTSDQKKELKQLGISKKDKVKVQAYLEAKKAEAEKIKAEEEAKKKAEEEEKQKNTTEYLLKEIRDLLKENKELKEKNEK